jgi:hypothetical protein
VNIRQFGEALSRHLTGIKLGTRFVSERAFESGVLVNQAWEISRTHPGIRVFSLPWGRRVRCKPSCEGAEIAFNGRVEGCPECWARSKARSTTKAFGTRNNFDLAAVDRQGGSLVVEVKWLHLETNRGPNGEFQRFLGQCTLAAAANDVVLGVCGLWGHRQKALDDHEAKLKEHFQQIGVQLIVLRSPAKANAV